MPSSFAMRHEESGALIREPIPPHMLNSTDKTLIKVSPDQSNMTFENACNNHNITRSLSKDSHISCKKTPSIPDFIKIQTDSHEDKDIKDEFDEEQVEECTKLIDSTIDTIISKTKKIPAVFSTSNNNNENRNTLKHESSPHFLSNSSLPETLSSSAESSSSTSIPSFDLSKKTGNNHKTIINRTRKFSLADIKSTFKPKYQSFDFATNVKSLDEEETQSFLPTSTLPEVSPYLMTSYPRTNSISDPTDTMPPLSSQMFSKVQVLNLSEDRNAKLSIMKNDESLSSPEASMKASTLSCNTNGENEVFIFNNETDQSVCDCETQNHSDCVHYDKKCSLYNELNVSCKKCKTLQRQENTIDFPYSNGDKFETPSFICCASSSKEIVYENHDTIITEVPIKSDSQKGSSVFFRNRNDSLPETERLLSDDSKSQSHGEPTHQQATIVFKTIEDDCSVNQVPEQKIRHKSSSYKSHFDNKKNSVILFKRAKSIDVPSNQSNEVYEFDENLIESSDFKVQKMPLCSTRSLNISKDSLVQSLKTKKDKSDNNKFILNSSTKQRKRNQVFV